MKEKEEEKRVCTKNAVSSSVIVKLVLSRLKVVDSGEQGLVLHWSEIVGSTLANHVKVYEIKYNNLILVADHPAWNQKVEMSKKRLLHKINTRYPGLCIKNIQVITR